MAHLLSFGHGYSARALAGRLLQRGWTITGTTRSAEKARSPGMGGVGAVVWPGGDLGREIEAASHVLISVGPSEAGDPVLAEWREILAARAPHLEWVGYLSSTGVYGDHQGGWVDESTDPKPETRRGERRAKAEAAWQALSRECGLPLHVFRLAGIYGPGRGPFAKLRKGTARRIIKPGQVFSRIHVDDIARVLLASVDRPDPGAIYNVCDDDPAPPQEVIAHAAELLGLPVPPAEDFGVAEMTPMARSFYAESKRVRNNRIRDELGVVLKYPSYREGLVALLDGDCAAGG